MLSHLIQILYQEWFFLILVPVVFLFSGHNMETNQRTTLFGGVLCILGYILYIASLILAIHIAGKWN